MFKKFFLAICLLICSWQTFAYHGKGFRILSEHVEMTPGTTGGLVELDDPKQAKMYAAALTTTSDKQARPYEYVFIDASHDLTIVNNTNTNQWYKYVVEVNCHGKSFRNIKHIELSPQGTFGSNARSYINVQEERAGTHTINALTEIVGESSASHQARATLSVRK